MTHLGAAAIPTKRGCGTRQRGGVYLECGLSENGLPVEHFIIDPPQPTGELAIPNRGVILIERQGIWHIVDRVGLSGYLNVADFVEEVRRFGASRRVQSNLDFSKLGPESRLLLVHPRAYIENYWEYPLATCPKTGQATDCHEIETSPDLPIELEPCAGLWWQDIEGGVPASWGWVTGSRNVVRQMPSFQYCGHARPGNFTPIYHNAFFMSLPLTRIVVVKDDAGRHMAKLARTRAASVPVEEVKK